MKFTVTPQKPVEIEVEVNGKTHNIEFYPSDLKTRQAFFEIYEELKAYKPAEIVPITDENGVSNLELESTREMVRFTEFLSERFDRVFGSGTAAIIMDGKCNPTELVRFICETARYFKAESEKLIGEYTAPSNDGVME